MDLDEGCIWPAVAVRNELRIAAHPSSELQEAHEPRHTQSGARARSAVDRVRAETHR